MTFKIDFRGRQKESRWTRYRELVLWRIGLSEYEISALKFNRLTNPRVRSYLRDIRREIERIQGDYALPSYADAAQFRRENYASLVDSGDISEWDPYVKMGYMEE